MLGVADAERLARRVHDVGHVGAAHPELALELLAGLVHSGGISVDCFYATVLGGRWTVQRARSESEKEKVREERCSQTGHNGCSEPTLSLDAGRWGWLASRSESDSSAGQIEAARPHVRVV